MKPGFTTISPQRDVVASFDREGRLFSFIEKGRTYRRTLASAVEVRWREDTAGAGGIRLRQRRQLNRSEACELFARVQQTAADVRSYVDGELRARLDTEILRWTPELLLAEADRFARVYKPITILPPDQYLSIVLQATEGCTWNKCTFCSFYQDRPFRVKSREEFERHIDEVLDFFGRGVMMRKSIFLGDGNALALSQSRIAPMMEAASNAFPGQPIYGFIDLYSGEQKSVSDWRYLVDLGLHRVYIGMETGLDQLLTLINKPGSSDELIDFVRRLKAAGLSVGLIVMVGIGGAQYKDAHAQATLEALNRMPLGEGDIIYLSPFIEQPESAYVGLRQAHDLTPLSEDDVEAELAQLAVRIRTMDVKAARYDIREFMY